MFKRLFIFCLCLLFWPSLSSAEPNNLLLERHRFSVGGTLQVPYYVTRQGTMGFNLDFMPSGSYFILDHWEVFLDAQLKAPLLVNDSLYRGDNPVRWGFGGGSKYYFDVGNNLYIYAGMFARFDMASNIVESLVYELGPMGGILVALTPSLALDVGINMKAVLSSDSFLRAEVVPAVLGIRYFF